MESIELKQNPCHLLTGNLAEDVLQNKVWHVAWPSVLTALYRNLVVIEPSGHKW